MLETVVYTSAAKEADVSEELLNEILEVSRRNNTQVGITGVLLCAEGTFIQVLEGAREDLDETMNRISSDERHSTISVLYRSSIEKRNFPDWSMGYRKLSGKDLSSGSFLLNKQTIAELDQRELSAEVLVLLKTFYKISFIHEAA